MRNRNLLRSFGRTFGFINKHPLARRHLLKAYSAFIAWQFRLLFTDKLLPVHFIGSTRVLAKRGLGGITGNIYTGLHEFEDMAFLLHLLRETDTFFDVGANVGSYTILASGVCGAKSLSFEPIPETFEILLKNLDLNHLHEKVKTVNAAAGHEQKTLTFTSDLGASNQVRSSSESKNEFVIVPVVNLDEFVAETPLLLKIDVEGFESEVLGGAEQLLNQESLKAIIIELNGSGARYNFEDKEIHQKLVAQGFKPYRYDPFSRHLKELDSYGSFNTIYIRNIRFAKNRISTANSFRIFSRSI